MSRSYKKHPHVRSGHYPKMKKVFNRKMRRCNKTEDIPNGNAYKKMNCSWEITDYICRCSWEEFNSWKWVQDLPEGERIAEWKRRYGSK